MENLALTAVLSMAFLAFFFAGVLAFAHKKLKVEEDPRVLEVYEFLPHVNCGACGHVSCHDFAESLILSDEDPLKCRVLGEDAREKILDYLGKEDNGSFPFLPLVRCSAGKDKKKPAADYSGIRTCRGAALVFSGGMECEYGCMGFGDCEKACPFGAIKMVDALPVIEKEKCTGCAKCAAACPRGIIDIAEKKFDKLYYVACSSRDGALRVRQICGVGCIACGICEKLSKEGLFVMKDALSREVVSKQGKQEEAANIASKCPTKVIKDI